MKRLIFTIVGTAVAFGTKFLSAQTSGLVYRYFDSEGIKIAFMEKGHGEPIIFFHAADDKQRKSGKSRKYCRQIVTRAMKKLSL